MDVVRLSIHLVVFVATSRVASLPSCLFQCQTSGASGPTSQSWLHPSSPTFPPRSAKLGLLKSQLFLSCINPILGVLHRTVTASSALHRARRTGTSPYLRVPICSLRPLLSGDRLGSPRANHPFGPGYRAMLRHRVIQFHPLTSGTLCKSRSAVSRLRRPPSLRNQNGGTCDCFGA